MVHTMRERQAAARSIPAQPGGFPGVGRAYAALLPVAVVGTTSTAFEPVLLTSTVWN
ncbi:protein of unknown function [Pararobbsia alpina]